MAGGIPKPNLKGKTMRIIPRLAMLAMAFSMPLLAQETKPLLNPKDLSGWKMAKGGELLDGKSDAANKRFIMKDGVLTIDPKVKGDITIQTVKEFSGDVHIKFEFKPDAKCNNDTFLRGIKFDLKKPDVKNLKVDEWNQFEIIVRGDSSEYKCNGESLKTFKIKPSKTPFGIRAEFGGIEIRNITASEKP
jgi:hypothetical protein